jgi:hypothetical protein
MAGGATQSFTRNKTRMYSRTPSVQGHIQIPSCHKSQSNFSKPPSI